ncbi:EpsG family protein [Prevotella sp. SGI.167]|uniref:EpsG family protein n=1 Tax=Prevotella sp. SGI.167 TaxID=3420566 RepID=UPI00404099E4
MVNEVGLPGIYVILLVILFLYRSFPKSNALYYTSVFALVCVAVLRGVEVGTDYPSYISDFENYYSVERVLAATSRTEKGFYWLLYYSNSLGIHYIILYGGMFVTTLWAILRLANYNRCDKSWVLLLFYMMGFYFMSFNIIRQMFAISLILLAVPWLFERKYVLFAGVTFLTSLLFHSSEMLFLLLIPLHWYVNKVNGQLNKTILYAGVIGSFVMYYVAQRFLFVYVLQLLSLLGMGDTYAIYIELAADRESIGNTTSMLYTILALVVVFLKNPKTYIFETYAVVISIVIFNLTNVMAVFAYRLFIDFNIFILFLIPLMLGELRNKEKRYFMAVIICFCSVMFTYKYYLNNNGQVKPYYFIFEDGK